MPLKIPRPTTARNDILGMRYLTFFFIGVAAIAALAATPATRAAPPTTATPTPIDSSDPARIPIPSHWVSVDLSEQTLTAYEGRIAIRTFTVSTGDADHPTWKGRFRVGAKHETIDVIGGDYYFKDVPYFIQYYYGFAIHAATWHDDFGAPVSHGCVNMKLEDAKWVYEFLSVGDVVYIHK